jgi:hypothetical protein
MALPGFVPGPRCASGTPAAGNLIGSALPGFGPALVARTTRTTRCSAPPTALPGVRPRPSLRGAVRHRGHRPGPRVLPVFVPGPRCTVTSGPCCRVELRHCRGSSPALVPGPRCAMPHAYRPAIHYPGRCRARSRPSLREVRHHAPGGPRARRCRGFVPGPRCAEVLEDTDFGQQLPALPGPFPALAARSSRRSGPRLTTWRCRGSASALVVCGSGRCSTTRRRDRRCRGSSPALVARSSGRSRRPAPRATLPGYSRPSLRVEQARSPGVKRGGIAGSAEPAAHDPSTATARRHAHTSSRVAGSSERCHFVGSLNPNLAAFGRNGQKCPFRSMTADADGWSWGLAGSRGRMAAGLSGFSLPFRRAKAYALSSRL